MPTEALRTHPAETLRQLHPARISRLMFSECFAPWMNGVKWLADEADSARDPLDDVNHFRQWEALVSESIATTLTIAGTTRDSLCEMGFRSLYGWEQWSENERLS